MHGLFYGLVFSIMILLGLYIGIPLFVDVDTVHQIAQK